MSHSSVQQLGDAPVTIWRELRKTSVEIPEGILQKAFEAADNGDWAGFLVGNGGPAPLKKTNLFILPKPNQQSLESTAIPLVKR